jgi:hypothetical protein
MDYLTFGSAKLSDLEIADLVALNLEAIGLGNFSSIKVDTLKDNITINFMDTHDSEIANSLFSQYGAYGTPKPKYRATNIKAIILALFDCTSQVAHV